MAAILLLVAGCKQLAPFDVSYFLTESVHFKMLNRDEKAIAELTVTSLLKPDIRTVSHICKLINFRTVSTQLQLDPVSADSNFILLNYLREQLSKRGKNNSNIYIGNMNEAKDVYKSFLRKLYDKDQISPSQYAKILDKMRQEPVVFPFVVYEWIETTP
ncbi:MAG: hypothetical protein JSS64_08345 [Bacteroidetes bacterium]|nr:hypothetical protein [Bacteroidota bacterium]MBS1776274.1 hypothetical protein [Bacteroidota bacterium]